MVEQPHSLSVWLHGCTGRMGHEVKEALIDPMSQMNLIGGSAENYFGLFTLGQFSEITEHEAASLIHNSDLIIDFSSPSGNKLLYDFIKKEGIQNTAVLIATTGLSQAEFAQWHTMGEAQKLRVMFAPNTSFGVLLVTKICREIAKSLRGQGFDIELFETHHRNKADSPSGTAKFIAGQIARQEGLELTYSRFGKRAKNELGVFGLRGGSVFGEHTIKFLGDFEEIEVSHKALSRSLFAKGALLLGSWLHKQVNGIYGLEDFN